MLLTYIWNETVPGAPAPVKLDIISRGQTVKDKLATTQRASGERPGTSRAQQADTAPHSTQPQAADPPTGGLEGADRQAQEALRRATHEPDDIGQGGRHPPALDALTAQKNRHPA